MYDCLSSAHLGLTCAQAQRRQWLATLCLRCAHMAPLVPSACAQLGLPAGGPKGDPKVLSESALCDCAHLGLLASGPKGDLKVLSEFALLNSLHLCSGFKGWEGGGTPLCLQVGVGS